jgi:anti-sigma regulatory factor (Ser/Thr protein kinase)
MPSLELSPDPTSPRVARNFVRAVLAESNVDRSTIEDAALLATELVTNSVIHASTDITLDVAVDAGAVHIAVTDSDMGKPVLQDQNNDATTGRGLFVLDRVASEWDVVYGASSKTVRFSLTNDLVGRQ